MSHEPLLNPVTKTCDVSTHVLASTAATVASKYCNSGVSAASLLKQSSTPLRPTRIASPIDADWIGMGELPLSPQPGPMKTVG